MKPILLAYLGIAFMTGLTFIGSSYGVTICGSAVVGAMKKNPDAMGTYSLECIAFFTRSVRLCRIFYDAEIFS